MMFSGFGNIKTGLFPGFTDVANKKSAYSNEVFRSTGYAAQIWKNENHEVFTLVIYFLIHPILYSNYFLTCVYMLQF